MKENSDRMICKNRSHVRTAVCGALFFLLLAGGGRPVQAANPDQVLLEPGKVYTSYDVTGDGEADTVSYISASVGTVSGVTGKGEQQGYCGFTFTVNGEDTTVEMEAEASYLEPQVVLVTLGSGEPFLLVSGMGDVAQTVCSLYHFGEEGLEETADLFDYYEKSGNGSVRFLAGEVSGVAEDRLTIRMLGLSSGIGYSVIGVNYVWEDGALDQYPKGMGTILPYGERKDIVNPNSWYTALRKINVYTGATSKELAFQIEAGTKVRITSVYSGHYIHYKLVLEDGKTGWYACPVKWKSPDFLELTY